MRLKLISFSVLILLITLIFWYFALPSKEKKWNSELLGALQKKDFSKADTIIKKLAHCQKEVPLSLYKAHLELAQGNLFESKEHLGRSRGEILSVSHSAEILAEILFLEASHAYLSCDNVGLARCVERLQQIKTSHPFLPLFEGIFFYSQGNYPEASPSFEKYLQDMSVESNPRTLLAFNLETQFSSSWVRLRLAHATIESGDMQKGREILESELHKMSAQDQEIQMAGNLFLGLSYLKEAEKIPFSNRHSLYKLVSFYFKSFPASTYSLQRERANATASLVKEIKLMIQEGIPTLTSEECPKTVDAIFAFVHLVEEWGNEKQLEEISDTLGEEVFKSLPAQEHLVRLYCHAIKTFPSTCLFRSLMINHCKEALLREIQGNDTPSFEPFWQILKNLEGERLVMNQIAYALIGEFPRIISNDTSDLTETQKAISFYQTLEPDTRRHEALALACANYAKLLWRRENEEKKATHLMQLSLAMTPKPKRKELHYRLTQHLTDLYHRAESCNTRKRMCCILDAFNTLKCGVKNLASPSKIANTIADGEYLLKAHQYPLAETTAEWVLKVSPHNEQALRLLGLSCFHQGEYERAIAALDQLSHPDEEVTQALAFCQVAEMQSEENHLAHQSLENE